MLEPRPEIKEEIKWCDVPGEENLWYSKGKLSPMLFDNMPHLFVDRFLHQLRTTTTDKIVLISNYTQTLDLFEKLCRTKKCLLSVQRLSYFSKLITLQDMDSLGSMVR